MSNNHPIIKGTLILTATGLITRFMGFFYRIFLSHTFGEEGVGLYQLIFPLYALGFSITAAGIQTELSRCVAARLTHGQKKAARELLYTALILTVSASCIVSILMQKYAPFLADRFLREPRCESLLVMLSYIFPFGAVHSCITGYYLGQKKTRVASISQLLEQTARILGVYLICQMGIKNGSSFDISIAVIGLILGEITSSVYCLSKIRSGPFFANIPRLKWSVFCKHSFELVRLSLPLTANRMLLNILQSVESISIPVRLQVYGMSTHDALSTYGVLTGMALPCILFPSALTNSVSTMLLPTVAEINAMDERPKMASLVRKSVYCCVFLGSACCVALLVFGHWMGAFLFHSTLAGDFIVTLAWMCPFLYANNTLISIINGIGKTNISFVINSIGLTIRILSVLYFIPLCGIIGYLHGLLASQIFIFVVCGLYIYYILKREPL